MTDCCHVRLIKVFIPERYPANINCFVLYRIVYWTYYNPEMYRLGYFTCTLLSRYCSSAASAVRRLPSAVRTTTPAFHVRSSGLFCSRPGGLQLATRLPARSVIFLCNSPGPENFPFLVLLAHTALCDRIYY